MTGDDKELEPFKTALGLYIEDPWERVKFIFKKNDYGEVHPDLKNVKDSAQLGFLMGVGIGGFIQQKKTLEEIRERSDAKLYHGKLDAYKQAGQESLKGFLKGAFIWGPRVAIFMGGFTLFTACAEAYRNKSGIAEYSIGGSVIGGILRFNFGIRGMLAGSVVGGILGTVYGLTYYGLSKLIHQDRTQMKYAQYAVSKYFKDQKSKALLEKEGKKLGLTTSTSVHEYENPLDALGVEEEPMNDFTEKN